MTRHPHTLSGIAAVLSAAALAGCHQTGTTTSSASADNTTTDLVHCYGINICKGHNDCGGASNSCAGQASCKGTGFVTMPSKACTDAGGETKDRWRGEISTAELTQCYGVNICKGHNDCKAASNSCAGQASCKGTGFIMTTAKSCGDIGGNQG